VTQKLEPSQPGQGTEEKHDIYSVMKIENLTARARD
jgi:hypothetical protein